MKVKSKTDKGSNGFMTLKVELPPTGIVRTISVPECMTLEDLHEAIQAVMGWDDEHLWHFVTGGRDAIIYEVPHKDDFAAFGRRLTMDATKATLRECDIAGWVGLDTPEDVERYLTGESAEMKTQKLKEALAHVKVVVPPKTEKAPKMSDEAEDLAQRAVSLRFGQKVQALLRQGEVGTAV